jgi:glycosyltransferase involved in cell wall biosynthesis
MGDAVQIDRMCPVAHDQNNSAPYREILKSAVDKMDEPKTIDVVICTCNRASQLDETLTALARQTQSAAVSWRALVVDNASTDATAAVVEKHRANGRIPALRRVFESEQGLTHARRRGVRETDAPWIAFIDDDNLLEHGWLEAVSHSIQAHPEAGGIGGRVILDWEVPPRDYVGPFGFCFAEQNGGDQDCIVDNLAGAGMVLRRSALVESGWLDRPLLADRVGKRLISGGDAEMAQRVHAAGYSLWFTPGAVLRHRIPPSRTTRQYLFRINFALGKSEALVSALMWPRNWESWHAMTKVRRRRWRQIVVRGFFDALRRRLGITEATAWACFALGFVQGVRNCNSLTPTEREGLLGAAAPRANPAAS